MWIKVAKVAFWIVIGFIVFAHLDHLPIMIFDEGRLAVSAFEMYKNGNFFLTTYDGSPDMWSMKPPFMIWCQVLFIKLVGYGPTAIRLPSAIAALATAILLFRFLRANVESSLFAYLAVGILMTTPGYIMIHGTRTGDYDAMFVLFNTFYCFQFFNYLKEGKSKYLWLVFVGIFMAVITKSVAGLICTPFLVIMALKEKAVLKILRTPAFYTGFFILVGLIVSYYMYRESINPGYWAVVKYEELGGRLTGAIQADKQPWYYYFRLIFNDHYYFWFPFAVLGVITGFLEKQENMQRIFTYCLLAAAYFLLIITITGTKLEWYEMPIYPFLAVVVAVFVNYLYNTLGKVDTLDQVNIHRYLPVAFLCIVFFYGFRTVLPNIFSPKVKAFQVESFNISYFLKDQYHNLDDPDKYFLVNDGYYSHLLFYKYFHSENGRNLQFKAKESLESGDHIILHELSVQDYVAENYNAEEIGSFRNVKVIRINAKK